MRLAGLRVLATITAPVAVTAVGLLAPATASATGPAVAAADEAAQAAGLAAQTTLRTVTPAVLTPEDDGLTLTGAVRNTGDETMVNVQALPRFSRNPVSSRAEIRRIADDETLYWGARHNDDFDLVADSLAPGEAGTFTVTLSRELLELGQAGVYVVGVDLLASPPEDPQRLRVATSRTVVPWLSDPAELPSVPMAVLWPLSARPSTMPDGTLLDDSLPEQLNPGEPLSGIVEAADGAPVTWAVDPDLLDTVDIVADGYRVATESGPLDGPRADSAAAQQWQQRFQEVTADRDVWMLPYAMPDVAALSRHDPPLAAELSGESLAAAETAAGAFGGASAGVAWLDAGAVTDEVLGTLAEAGTETVVVPAGAVESEGRSALGGFDIGERTLRAVVTDGGLSAAAADATAADDRRAGAVDLRQRWAAETAMVALAAARDGAEPELMVAAPPLRWRPAEGVAREAIDTWTSLPWIEPVDLAEQVAGAERVPEVSPEPAEEPAGLPEASVVATGRLLADTSQYSALLADPGGASRALVLATLRSASTGWRSDPDAGVSYAEAISRDITTRFGQISVNVPESVTLSSRAGSFPLTVTNELSDPVNVRLQVQSANPDRLRIATVPTQEMQPGEQRLVEVTAQAAANGRVPVEVQLTTDDGRPLGRALPTVVNATDYGTIGWLIVGVAGALFAATIVRRNLRSGRRRKRRRRGAAPLDTTDRILHDLPPEARPTQEAAR